MSAASARIVPRWAWLVVFAFCFLAGCAPKIGDHCSISTDCSANGDRLCDTTQPGGYCTSFNCEPDSCPEEAVCVAFNERSCPDTTAAATAADGGVSNSAQSVRFQRTFCMLTCNGNADCRDGYTCLDVSADPARQIVDTHPVTRHICTVAPASTDESGAPLPVSTQIPAVCLPPDASFSRWESTSSEDSSAEGLVSGQDGASDAASPPPDAADDTTSEDAADDTISADADDGGLDAATTD